MTRVLAAAKKGTKTAVCSQIKKARKNESKVPASSENRTTLETYLKIVSPGVRISFHTRF